VGKHRSLNPLPMSWLRFEHHHHPDGTPYRTFGKDSYVKSLYADGGQVISVWRIAFKVVVPDAQRRLVYRAEQCLDCDGPKIAPNMLASEDFGAWPQEELAAMYNNKLASANSAKEGCRHYVLGYHHFTLPSACWILEPTIDPIIDVLIDVGPDGNCEKKQTVLQVRHVLNLGSTHSSDGSHTRQQMHAWLETITTCNFAIHRAAPASSARAGKGDVGAMHALGTRVLDGSMRTVPFATNGCVPEEMLRDMVVALHEIGNVCFPDILSVILSTEADSGLVPAHPMDGIDGKRVGYTIDMSINLGNSSHFDNNDASQGYAVWTEENPSTGSNWFLSCQTCTASVQMEHPFQARGIF
jgi:hypothetical protein